MDTPVLADQQLLMFPSSMWTLDALLRTYQDWWLIAADRKSELRESVVSACLNDDSHINLNINIISEWKWCSVEITNFFLFVWISEMKLDNYHFLKYLCYWPHLYCYNHNISADMFFGLLQVFHVKLGSPHRISNWTLYLNHRGRLFQFC